MQDSGDEEFWDEMRETAGLVSRGYVDAEAEAEEEEETEATGPAAGEKHHVDESEEDRYAADADELDETSVARLRQIVERQQSTKRQATRRKVVAPPPDDHPPDASRTWLSAIRMTRTEVSLRLALHLIQQHYVNSDVTVTLTGDEMKPRPHRPIFPVEEFLTKHGCQKQGATADDWPDRYSVDGHAHAIILRDKLDDAPLSATLASGGRLLVDVMGGPTYGTRSCREHTQLRTAIGRAITFDEVRRIDVVAVAMPRSKRFRELALLWRDAPRFVASGLRLICVDRAGNVDGLRGIRSRRKAE